MWSLHWIVHVCGSILLVTTYTNGQQELGDIDLGCPYSSYLFGNFCYLQWPTHLTYLEAEEACKTSGGLLAPIKDVETQHFLHRLYIRKFLHQYWFGLAYNKTNKNWIFSDNTPLASFNNWCDGEPNNALGIEHCAALVMERHLSWFDANCANRKLYICEYSDKTRANKCGDRFPTYGSYCYELSKDLATYNEAAIDCQRRGGILATIKDDVTFKFIKKLIYAERFWLKMLDEEMKVILQFPERTHNWLYTVWVGIQFRNNTWTYSDQTPVVYTNWAFGAPRNVNSRGSCVQLTPYVWNQAKCNIRQPFICQYPVKMNCLSRMTKVEFIGSKGARNEDPHSRILVMALVTIFVSFSML